MDLGNEVGCDFCEHTSKDWGRVIYECDGCGADCCSDCSTNAPGNDGLIYCDPDPSGHPPGCYSKQGDK